MSRNSIQEKTEVRGSLFKLSKELEIIPPDFSSEKFARDFFYLFIERRHTESPAQYHEDLYGQKYRDAMLNAFNFAFERLAKKKSRPINIEFINRLYQIATSSAIEDEMRGYRERGSSAGFGVNNVTKAYLKKIRQDNYKARLKLLPEVEVGVFYNKFFKQDAGMKYNNLELEMRYICYELSSKKIEKTITDLLAIYYKEIDEIEKKHLSEKDAAHEKTQLIATFISDFSLFHPHKDGNGRLSCFLLLNCLLIQQNLTPSMMLDPWLMAYSTPAETLKVVKEAQNAYREFFLKDAELTMPRRTQPVEIDLNQFCINQIFNANAATHKILDLFLNYLKIKEMQSRQDIGDSSQERVLEKRKELLKTQITELEELKEIEVFFLPIPTEILLAVTVMRFAAFLIEEADDEDKRYSFLNLAQYFKDNLGVEIDISKLTASCAKLKEGFKSNPKFAEMRDYFGKEVDDFLSFFPQSNDAKKLRNITELNSQAKELLEQALADGYNSDGFKETLNFSDIFRFIDKRCKSLLESKEKPPADILVFEGNSVFSPPKQEIISLV